MKIDSEELTDDEAYAIENGEEINEGIYSPTYDDQNRYYIEYQLEGLLESAGEIKYHIDRLETAEKDIRGIETLIINSIGEVSYSNIIESLFVGKLWLERDYEGTWKSYDDLNEYVKNTFK